MFTRLVGWLLSMMVAFSAGAGIRPDAPADKELQQKVQGHMDVIVDESAAIVDDVMEEARKNEKVKEAEEFIDDIKEISQNTRDDIKAHFGEEETEAVTEDEEAVTEEADAEEAEAAEETGAETVEEETEDITEEAAEEDSL